MIITIFLIQVKNIQTSKTSESLLAPFREFISRNSTKNILFIVFWLNLEKIEKYKFGPKKIITEVKKFLLINKFANKIK